MAIWVSRSGSGLLPRALTILSRGFCGTAPSFMMKILHTEGIGGSRLDLTPTPLLKERGFRWIPFPLSS